ncbi:MAG: Synechococcus phage [Bacteroidota bacterium]|jgi:hypothetical protein
MALLRDYELPGTGLVVSNAYHVVTTVKVDKRTSDFLPPPDNSRPDGLTHTPDRDTPEQHVYWKAGYIAEIAVTIWKDKEARDSGAKPIGFIGINPSDNQHGVSIGTEGMDHRCKFFLEVPSELNHVEQAYRHLLTTDYYSGCVEI